MKTRAERAHELCMMAQAGGYHIAHVVALFINARPEGSRFGMTVEHMIEVILDHEEPHHLLMARNRLTSQITAPVGRLRQ